MVKKHGNHPLRFKCSICGHTFSLNDPLPLHRGQQKRIDVRTKAKIMADYLFGVPAKDIVEKYGISRPTFNRIKKEFSERRVIYVWRTAHHRLRFRESRNYFMEEIERHGRLRQGYGWVDIRRGLTAFTDAYLDHYVENAGEEKWYIARSKRTFENLKTMLLVKKGDYVVVPKFGEYILLAEVVGGYEHASSDFYGHYVRVRPLRLLSITFEDPQDIHTAYDYDVQLMWEMFRNVTPYRPSRFREYVYPINGRLARIVLRLVRGYSG